jgi:hypothetical protein
MEGGIFSAIQMSVTHTRDVRRKREYIGKTANESTSSENERKFLQIIHYVAKISCIKKKN